MSRGVYRSLLELDLEINLKSIVSQSPTFLINVDFKSQVSPGFVPSV